MSIWLEDFSRFLPFGAPLLFVAIALCLNQVRTAHRRNRAHFTDRPEN